MSTNQIRIKTGDTFLASVAYTPENQDDPADLAGYTITSQVRTPSGQLAKNLTVTKASDNMSFTVGLTSVETAELQPGQHFMDILFSYGGTKHHSETFIFVVEKGITQ